MTSGLAWCRIESGHGRWGGLLLWLWLGRPATADEAERRLGLARRLGLTRRDGAMPMPDGSVA